MLHDDGFFLTDSFNPRPYWDGAVLIDLNGAEKYEEDTIFIPGRYEVLVQAGSCVDVGMSGKVFQTITILQKFIVRAYCGSSGTSVAGGTNLYSGPFKVNPYHGDITPVSHIFGNCGASGRVKSDNNVRVYGSGNCLGDGALNGSSGIGAGSCMHIMPIGGVFGTDYLFAFHTTSSSALARGALTARGGSGSSYGGSGSGSVYILPFGEGSITGYSGGNTPYGIGGARVSQSGPGLTAGNDGTGIGHGYGAGPINSIIPGSAAWFNGTSWQDSNDRTEEHGEEGKIYLKYLGQI